MVTPKPILFKLHDDCTYTYPCYDDIECCLKNNEMNSVSEQQCCNCRDYQPEKTE